MTRLATVLLAANALVGVAAVSAPAASATSVCHPVRPGGQC